MLPAFTFAHPHDFLRVLFCQQATQRVPKIHPSLFTRDTGEVVEDHDQTQGDGSHTESSRKISERNEGAGANGEGLGMRQHLRFF